MSRLYEYIQKDVLAVQEILASKCQPYINDMGRLVHEPNGWFTGLLYRGADKLMSNYIIKKPHVDRKPKDTPVELSEKIDDMMEKKFGWRPRSQGVFATFDAGVAHEYGDPYIFIPCGTYKYIWSPEIEDMFSLVSKLASYNLKKFGMKSSWYDEYKAPPDQGGVDYKGYWKFRGKKYTPKALGDEIGNFQVYLYSSTNEAYAFSDSYPIDVYRSPVWVPTVTFEQYQKSQFDKVAKSFKTSIETYMDTELKKASKTSHEIMFKCNEYVLIDPSMQEEVIQFFKGRPK